MNNFLPKSGASGKGQVIIISLIFMLVILVLVGALLGFVHQNARATRAALVKEQALQLAEAGIDKAVWRLNQTAGGYAGESGAVLGTGVFDVSVAILSPSVREITATGFAPDKASPQATRQIKVQVGTSTTNASFFYGVQVGDGGLVMSNNARVNGSVYSNGTIDGEQGARITGDAFSAKSTGRIFDRLQIDGNAYANRLDSNVTIGGTAFGQIMDRVTIGGNVFAHTISRCTIGGNASYTNKTSCTIGGAENSPYAGESDPEPLPFPITDEQINDWKTQAAAGGTITGNYTLTNGAQASLGPKKITGELVLSNNAILTLTGPIWVVGKITVSNNAVVALDAAYGDNSEVMIADDQINISNNGVFQRAGPNSYILMITTSTSGNAFNISNNADSLVAYAASGTVNISNNVNLREVTGWQVVMSNNAEVNYETGLANLTFTGGPGASWTVVRGTWREIK